jgi:AcrR family transcriptional regulator
MSEPTTRAARRAATSRKIIEAAQHEFGEHGFEATTVRAIARRAGIDPSLVIQHYGSKEHLFRIATELPSDAYAIAVQLPAGTPREELVAHLLDVLAVRLGTPPPETRALVRSMLTSPAATASPARLRSSSPTSHAHGSLPCSTRRSIPRPQAR